MALAQIKHRPHVQGLVARQASARRRLPRRALRKPFGLNRPVLATNHLGASYYGLSYDNQGRRASMTKGTGVLVSYAYDGLGRLSSMTNDLAGVIYDISYGFGYNPAGGTQNLYPHCLPCSRRQGGEVRQQQQKPPEKPKA